MIFFIRLIKNIALVYFVCKKYKLKFIPIFHSDIDGVYRFSDRTIKAKIHHPEFVSIFLHELGHHIHHKIVNYDVFFKVNENDWHIKLSCGKDHYKVIEAEAFASRFAMKTRKVNNSYLVTCFNTYVSMPFKKSYFHSSMKYMQYIDHVYTQSKKILFL